MTVDELTPPNPSVPLIEPNYMPCSPRRRVRGVTLDTVGAEIMVEPTGRRWRRWRWRVRQLITLLAVSDEPFPIEAGESTGRAGSRSQAWLTARTVVERLEREVKALHELQRGRTIESRRFRVSRSDG